MDDTWWRSMTSVDRDQITLYSLPVDGNNIILGPPGCGKTNVLLLRAVYLKRAGKANSRVLMFGRTLAEFVESGARSNGKYPPDRISTFATLAHNLYRQLTGHNLPFSRTDLSHDDKRHERLARLIEAVDAAKLNHTYYDGILVDEVQDMWRDELALLARLTERLYVVGDSRQRIYARNEGIQAALDLGCEERQLKFHYRLGRAICRVADRILLPTGVAPLEKHSQYDEARLPSSAKLHDCPSLADQFALIADKLRVQLRAYPNQWLGIIVPVNKRLDTLESLFEQSDLADKVQIHREGQREFAPDRPICVITAHSAKGTEFRCVHLFSAESFGRWYTREIGFTVVTRAKTAFDLYKTGTIDGSLEAALLEERVPDAEEVF